MGNFFGWMQVCVCFAASIGYLYQQDIRQALYFFGAAFITATVVWK